MLGLIYIYSFICYLVIVKYFTFINISCESELFIVYIQPDKAATIGFRTLISNINKSKKLIINISFFAETSLETT